MTDTTTAPPAAPLAFDPGIRSEIERQIAEKVVTNCLALGYSISVNDGEETTLVRSRDLAAIAEAMATTDEDYLFIHTAEGQRLGFVWLIYGNGCDLISDHTANAALEEALKPATDLAERFSR